jgi:hypothetical protein
MRSARGAVCTEAHRPDWPRNQSDVSKMDRVTAGYQGMVTSFFLYYHDDDEANEQGDTEKREYDHVRLLSCTSTKHSHKTMRISVR